jgi:hypothetical protein
MHRIAEEECLSQKALDRVEKVSVYRCGEARALHCAVERVSAAGKGASQCVHDFGDDSIAALF